MGIIEGEIWSGNEGLKFGPATKELSLRCRTKFRLLSSSSQHPHAICSTMHLVGSTTDGDFILCSTTVYESLHMLVVFSRASDTDSQRTITRQMLLTAAQAAAATPIGRYHRSNLTTSADSTTALDYPAPGHTTAGRLDGSVSSLSPRRGFP